jgi:hypothetical protein
VSGGRYRLRRLVRHRRRAVAAGLAMTAAALVAAAGPSESGHARAQKQDHTAAPGPASPAPELVTAPVRIADAAAVRLLRPGDHVDVIAADASPAGGVPQARVVAAGALVLKVPGAGDGPAESGALLVLSVPRPTAARLAGAGTTSRLAVTLC